MTPLVLATDASPRADARRAEKIGDPDLAA